MPGAGAIDGSADVDSFVDITAFADVADDPMGEGVTTVPAEAVAPAVGGSSAGRWPEAGPPSR